MLPRRESSSALAALATGLCVAACVTAGCRRQAPSPKDRPPDKIIPGSEQEVEVVFVGDVLLARRVESTARRLAGKRWPDFIFDRVRERIQRATVAVANLECSVSERGKALAKDFPVRGRPEALEAMARAGFDVVSLANNHILDFGPEAAADTERLARKFGMVTAGLNSAEHAFQEAQVVRAHGIKLAFLAYTVHIPEPFHGLTPRPYPADPSLMANDIKRARRRADHVIVSIHAGLEYWLVTTARQRQLEQRAKRAGAAVVVFHHTHTPLPASFELPKYVVAWGLGNFVFDLQFEWKKPRVWRSELLSVRFSKKELVGAQLEPVSLDEENRPRMGGDLDIDSMTKPYKPDGAIRADLLQRLSQAELERGAGPNTTRCEWKNRRKTGPLERNSLGSIGLAGFFQCSDDVESWVGKAGDISKGVWREGIWANPSLSAGGPIRIRWNNLPLGSAIVGFAGLGDWPASEQGADPVRLEIRGAGRAAQFKLRGGWQQVRLDTPDTKGAGDVEVLLSAPKGKRRRTLLRLWTVDQS